MIGTFFDKAFKKVVNEFKFITTTFIHGSWKTKVSYGIMGFGNISRGQVAKGLLFFLFEAIFIFYMIISGGYWLGKAEQLNGYKSYLERKK